MKRLDKEVSRTNQKQEEVKNMTDESFRKFLLDRAKKVIQNDNADEALHLVKYLIRNLEVEDKQWVTLEKQIEEPFKSKGLDVESIGIQYNKSDKSLKYTIIVREI